MDTSKIRKRLILSGFGVWVNRVSYFKATKKWLNLKNPKTWSEKLFWLNKYWQPELKSICADKYRVREWVAQKGYSDILIPMLGVYDKSEDIVFEDLPNRFVLKCNHGCACNVIVEDKSKLDIPEAKRKLDGWLKRDFSLDYNETHYHNILPKIICEQFLPVKSSADIVDYKIHCFEGIPKFIAANFDRDPITLHPHAMVFSPRWERMFCLKEEESVPEMKCPQNLDDLLRTARTLSEGMPYVRVDLYSIGEKLFFGELTFTPSGNMIMVDYKPEFDAEMGQYIDISKIKKQ